MKKNITEIFNAVAKTTGLSATEIKGKSKRLEIVMARVAIAILAIDNGYRNETISATLHRHRTAIYHYKYAHLVYSADTQYLYIIKESNEILKQNNN